MCRTSWLVAVCCLFIGAIGAHLIGQTQAQAPATKPARPAYEYKVVGTDGIVTREKELNELGAAGWELVAAVPSVYEHKLKIGSSSNRQAGLSGVSGETQNAKEGGYMLFRRQH